MEVYELSNAETGRSSNLMHACRWETGYWGTMDIAHDRAGYYLCWGCLNWVPAIYTSPALYLTEHPIQWPLAVAAANLIAGAAAIYINYDSDRQRQVWLWLCLPACISPRQLFFLQLRYSASDVL